jgi:molybdate transport system substrate-binding protein
MRPQRFASVLACISLLPLAFTPGLARAAEVKVIVANALKESVTEIVASFERASGHKVTMAWGGTEGIAKRVGGGEVFDLVIIAAANVDRLMADGRIAPGGRTDYAKSGIGMAVRSGLPRPDVSSREAIKAAILSAKSIAYSSGPSGFYVADLIKAMGIADQVKDRIRQPPSGTQVAELIVKGEADFGFQQVSELAHVKGIDYLGPLPADIQHTTVYSIGLHASAPSPDAARQLAKALSSPEAGAAIRKAGMDPA